MSCEKYRELILTDYIDGEIQDDVKKELVEEHLNHCPECYTLYEEVKQSFVNPLQHISRTEPGEHVWQNIKEAIDDQPVTQERPGLWERLGWLWPRPVLAFATICVVFFMVSLSQRPLSHQNYQVAQSHVEQANGVAEYMVAQLDYVDDAFDEEELTDIEQYFL